MPIELLLFVREASGSPTPLPTDRMRDGEMIYVDALQTALEAGIRPAASSSS